MPVGKNSLKRVSNNGYSKVATAAPDMEHSTVEEIKKEDKKPVEAAPKKKASVKTSAEPKIKAFPKKEETSRPDGFIKISFGDELPVHLL